MTPSITTTGLGISAAVALALSPWVIPADVDSSPVGSSWVATTTVPRAVTAPPLAAEWTSKASKQAPDPREVISELKRDSGLTADQLGRLLGVTRRSVHNWAAGTPITSTHAQRVQELSDLVFGLDASSPEERRSLMLNSNDGPSLFDSFVSGTTRPQKVHHNLPVGELFA